MCNRKGREGTGGLLYVFEGMEGRIGVIEEDEKGLTVVEGEDVPKPNFGVAGNWPLCHRRHNCRPGHVLGGQRLRLGLLWSIALRKSLSLCFVDRDAKTSQ